MRLPDPLEPGVRQPIDLVVAALQGAGFRVLLSVFFSAEHPGDGVGAPASADLGVGVRQVPLRRADA